MTGQNCLEAWREAGELFKRWQALSGELQLCAQQDDLEGIRRLLEQRRQLSKRLDAWKTSNGIASWGEKPAAAEQDAELAALWQEINGLLPRLLADDRRLREEMEGKLQLLREKIGQVKQTRSANLAYRGRHKPNRGAFIDTKK